MANLDDNSFESFSLLPDKAVLPDDSCLLDFSKSALNKLGSKQDQDLEVCLMQASLDALRLHVATDVPHDYSYQCRSQIWATAMIGGVEAFVKQKNAHMDFFVKSETDQNGRKSLLIVGDSRPVRVSVSVEKRVTGVRLEQNGVPTKFYPAPYVEGGLAAKYLNNEERRVNSRLAMGIIRQLNNNLRGRSTVFLSGLKQKLKDVAPVIEGLSVPVPCMDKMMAEYDIAAVVSKLTSDPHKFPGVRTMANLSKRLDFIANNTGRDLGVRRRDPMVEFMAVGMLAADAAGRDPNDVVKAARKLYLALRSSAPSAEADQGLIEKNVSAFPGSKPVIG